MSQHTPGAWIVNGHAVEAIDERRTIVCEVTGGLENPTMQADARLIAAAPDLLAALQLAYAAMNHMGDVLNELDAVEPDDEEKTAPAFEAARAAIRKATETP